MSWFKESRRGAHLDQNEIQLVQVSLLLPHPSLIRRNVDCDLNDEIADARLLFCRQGLPFCGDELFKDLEGNVLDPMSQY